MKKILLSLAILLTGVALARAGDRTGGVPRNQQGNASVESLYLGVDYSTTGLTTDDVLVSSGESVFAGIAWSSNTAATDRVTLFDATGTVAGFNNTNANQVYTIDLSTHSYAAVSTGADVRSGLGGIWTPPAPTRFRRGIVVRASVGTITRLTILYNNFRQ